MWLPSSPGTLCGDQNHGDILSSDGTCVWKTLPAASEGQGKAWACSCCGCSEGTCQINSGSLQNTSQSQDLVSPAASESGCCDTRL